MNYTVEYNQGFYHALNPKSRIEECPYVDETRAIRWIEGYYEGSKATKESTSVSGTESR